MKLLLCRRSLVGSLALASSPALGIEAGLRDVAARAGVSFGSAVVASVLDGNSSYAALVAREAALLVPESDAKWDVLQPSPGHFEFAGLDRILTFAASHGQMVRGHTLVWGISLPSWVLETEMTAARAQSVLESHIAAVLGFTRGRITEWDVVNEPIADPRWLPGPDLRDNVWFRPLRERYLDVAFRTARAADPALRLVLNEYGLEAADWRAEEKRKRLLRTLRGLQSRGVPIDGIGLQAHLRLDEPFMPSAFARFLRELRSLGLSLRLTELDVIEPERSPLRDVDIPARDAAAAERVHAVVSTALAEGCSTILTWGLADQYSWMNAWPPGRRPDGAEVRSLPFDRNSQRKPMWHALRRAFEGLPAPRGG